MAVISGTVFDFDIMFAAVTATVLAVVDQANSCMLIGRFCLTAACVGSYDFVISQLRRTFDVLIWFRITFVLFLAKIQLCV